MVPKGKRKASAKGRAVPKAQEFYQAAVDEAEEEVKAALRGATDERRRRDAAKLDPAKTLAAIDLMRRGHRLPEVFNDEVRQQWQEWHDTVPTSLSKVPASEFVVAMPRKCNPEGKVEAAVTAPRQQLELISFNNEGASGATRTKTDLERAATALMERTLSEEDVPIDSTVALKCEEGVGGAKQEPGEGTPFFVGDVKRVELAASSSSKDPPVVVRVLVHFRIPYGGRGFTDDPNKPWHLACLCRQQYNKSHERWKACKSRMLEFPCSLAENTTQYLDWFDADRILETKLKMNEATNTLHIDTKRRLAETNKEWKAILKVTEKSTKK